MPGFPALDSPAQAALLAALSPILRETLYLVSCGLLGACGVLSAALAIRRLLPAACAASVSSLALSTLPALLWQAPLLPAVSLTAVGWAVGMALWLACLAASRVFIT